MNTKSTTTGNAIVPWLPGVGTAVEQIDQRRPPTSGNVASTTSVLQRLVPAPRRYDHVHESHNDADRRSRRRTEECHAEHEAQECAADTEASPVHGDEIAAKGEEEQEANELHRVPVRGLGSEDCDGRRAAEHGELSRKNEPLAFGHDLLSIGVH